MLLTVILHNAITWIAQCINVIFTNYFESKQWYFLLLSNSAIIIEDITLFWYHRENKFSLQLYKYLLENDILELVYIIKLRLSKLEELWSKLDGVEKNLLFAVSKI